MGMSCDTVREKISPLLDGELTEAEAAAVTAHIRACPDCRGVYDALAGIAAALGGDMADPPEALFTGVMERIGRAEAEAAPVTPLRRAEKRRWMGYAAAACLAVVAGVGAFTALQSRRDGAPPESAEVRMDAYEEVVEAPEEPVLFAAPAAEAPAAEAPMPDAGYGAAGKNDAAAPEAAEAAEAEAVMRAPKVAMSAGTEDAAVSEDRTDERVRLASEMYPVDSPAAVPAGRESGFEALLRDAGVPPAGERHTVACVEYRGVIYEFSTDGRQLVWRDAAEGYPTVSPAAVEDLLDLLEIPEW